MSRSGSTKTPKTPKSKIRGKSLEPIRNADHPVVSVVIPAMNECKTIAQVIRNAYRVHPQTEVIVVTNGSTDGTREIANRLGAKVINFKEPLGHDVGRSVGARAANGKVILFTDGDIVIRTEDLIPLVKAVEQGGADVALNQYLGPVEKSNVHNVVLAKHVLNIALSRQDLQGASMTTIPHAMSIEALRSIGEDNLSVPPKAQAIAICKGLQVRAVHYVNVGRINRIRRRGKKDPLEQLIVGDHLEALHWAANASDDRCGKPDLARLRSIVR